jgi:integral membrane protein
MLKPLVRFGYIQGLTLILVLLVALPMKYVFGLPQVFNVVAPIHALLFGVFLLCLLFCGIKQYLPWWAIPLGVIGAVIPFGPFAFDEWVIKRYQERN